MSLLSDALLTLRPSSAWYIKGAETYENIVWADNNTTIPTQEEINETISVLEKKAKYKAINDEYSAKIAKAVQSGIPSDKVDTVLSVLRAEWKQKLLEVSNG